MSPGTAELAHHDRLGRGSVDAVVLHELRKGQLVIRVRMNVDEVRSRTLDDPARPYEPIVPAARRIGLGVVEEPHRDERGRIYLTTVRLRTSCSAAATRSSG